MGQIEVFEEIDAPPAVVWEVLMDFERYPEWNPLIPEIDGTPAVGERLRVRLEFPDSRPLTFRPEVVAFEPERRLVWVGRLLLPYVLDGYHEFHLEPVGDERTRLLHRETFRGALVAIVLDEEAVETGFREMNRALKVRAEDFVTA